MVDVKDITATKEKMTPRERYDLKWLNIRNRLYALRMFGKDWTIKVNGKTVRAATEDNEETPVCKKRNHPRPFDC